MSPPPQAWPSLIGVLDPSFAIARGLDPRQLLDAWLRAGLRALRIRLVAPHDPRVVTLLPTLAASCRASGALLLVDAHPLALSLTLPDAWFLSARTPAPTHRSPLGTAIGFAAHAEAWTPRMLRADFLIAAPLHTPRSKAGGRAPLTYEGVRRIARGSALPTWALGGVEQGDLPVLHTLGLAGAAVLGPWHIPRATPLVRSWVEAADEAWAR